MDEDDFGPLTPREAYVLRLRRGLGHPGGKLQNVERPTHPPKSWTVDPAERGRSFTLKEIGHELEYSVERIRQIEKAALAKLKRGL